MAFVLVGVCFGFVWCLLIDKCYWNIFVNYIFSVEITACLYVTTRENSKLVDHIMF